MKYTSAQAAKILRQLKEEHQRLLAREAETQVFLAAVGEDPESLRPEYDYGQVQEKLAGLEEKIRKKDDDIKISHEFFEDTSVFRLCLSGEPASIAAALKLIK